MKNKEKHKGKQVQEKPEGNPLENEIEYLIAMEKAKRKIMNKLVQPSHQSIEK